MQKQLTSQFSNLSDYKYGVIYILERYKEQIEIDEDTANKLADILLTNHDLKFVKIKTTQGVQVINISEVRGIRPREDRANAIIKAIQWRLEAGVNKDPKTLKSGVEVDLKQKIFAGDEHIGARAVAQKEFDYFYELVLGKQQGSTLKPLPEGKILF